MVINDAADGDMMLDDVIYYVQSDLADGDSVLDDYVLGTYNNLKKVYNGTGLECHHLVEKRLIYVFKQCSPTLTQGQFMSTPLNPQAHQVFTNLWRNALPYGGTYTLNEVIQRSQDVYKDYPALLEAVNEWFKAIGAM